MRNWDYRFCWLRDATLTLLAMLEAGYSDEAEAWRAWLLRAVAGDPADLQIMYGIAGERRLDERELDWLPGFEGSQPVRVGNAASEQLQLDVYGEVLDALYLARKHGVRLRRQRLVAHAEAARVARGRLAAAGRRHLGGARPAPALHALQGDGVGRVRPGDPDGRGVRAAGHVDRWRSLRDEIHAEVCERAWSESKAAFAQSYDSDELDASVLLMPLVGFLEATDERMVSTVEAIRRELTQDGLVLRYRPQERNDVDGLPGGEGVFLPCSFWLADVLALQGRHDEARELFERLLDLRNDVGLLSEEYDPVARRQLGNFPQAFTHLALVNTALVLGRGEGMRSS